jgi:uncharacterized protein
VSTRDLPLVDHHCHGVVSGDLDRAAFELLINEGFDPAPRGTSHFDSPVGLAVRRWCAPVLDLEPLGTPEAYLERRSELGADEVNRRLMSGAGVEALLVDASRPSSPTATPGASTSTRNRHPATRWSRLRAGG